MPKKRLVGFHVSIEGGISNSVPSAEQLQCSAFQIFTRSPRRWAAKPLDPNDVSLFKSRLRASTIAKNSVAVHMPYLPNLASGNDESYVGSINVLADELVRCSILSIPYLVIHLGNHGGAGSAAGVQRLSAAVSLAIDKAEQMNKAADVMVLLENSAGQKNSIGSKFEELRVILDKIGGARVGVCIDTCHLFASGFDLRAEKGIDLMVSAFEDTIGYKSLKWIHLNDSKDQFRSNRDRHENIGKGKIGEPGMKAILDSEMAKAVPLIMETPRDTPDDDKNNMTTVQRLLS